jgi:Na+/citrate or Na+/malate symporter
MGMTNAFALNFVWIAAAAVLGFAITAVFAGRLGDLGPFRRGHTGTS